MTSYAYMVDITASVNGIHMMTKIIMFGPTGNDEYTIQELAKWMFPHSTIQGVRRAIAFDYER